VNIIVLLAGRSSRFSKYYNIPKHLINIKKKTMIRAAVESIKIKATYIFVVLENEFIKKTIQEINELKVKKRIIKIKNITKGPAESAYIATKKLNLNSELMIINCDQIMNWNPTYFLNHVRKFDGGVVTYFEKKKANSYASVNENLLVKKIKEKKVISNISLNGIHYWKKNKFFNESYLKMKKK
jgi:choline kinase